MVKRRQTHTKKLDIYADDQTNNNNFNSGKIYKFLIEAPGIFELVDLTPFESILENILDKTK